MKRKLIRFFTGLVFAALLAAPVLGADRPVKLWEEQVIIPTYLIGPPEPNPQFYFGGNSQGAQHRIYPYPAYDNLTTEKADKSYKMVYLENEFIRVGILPESGGKIFEAIDKTNGYNFFYRQHVIKPALISLLGAWISGGVEWDVPHHHRATSFLPVQYTTEESTDGSKTVWVGELELRDRMRWAVGLTLRPGKSYLEASFRIMNRTPVPTSMLCFSNAAVNVNDSYQVIFPPSTQYVTFHGKREFTTWPIATTRYNGSDFTAGVDVSWYKNHYNANSMFAWNYQDDFFAGYDHGKNAGTMSIADHNAAPGKKFWTWGNNPNGRAQDTLLTDSDGPYIELMTGAYSDNQPDYSWLQPFETRVWTQYWYPFRDIGGVTNANIEAAVNLEVKEGKAFVGFYPTSDHPRAKVTVKLKDQILLEEQTAINPSKSYVKTIDLPAGADPHDLIASISANGKVLVSYSPVKLEPEAMPGAVQPPLPPQRIKTNEELYLTGVRIEQFHAPGATPDPYWQEALKRDPGDVRVNTTFGIDYIKAGRFAEAEQVLRRALERATGNYTSPKDGEPFYYLGLALKAQGKLEDAFKQFFRSTWSAAWRGPGYFELSEIASARGDFEDALGYAERSLEADALNVRALALKSALLRQTKRNAEALAVAEAIGKIDPLDVRGMTEQWLANPNPRTAQALMITLKTHPATALETAADYLNAGLWQDGTAVLTQIVKAAPDKTKVSPLVYYDLGYFAQRSNHPDSALEYYRQAAGAPTDYVFPFQMEMIRVLEQAMQTNPSDARAPYYLGNLLFDWQPERAVALWEKSASMGADFPSVYRNLALVYTRQDNRRDEARACLEKAVQYGGSAMVFNELDKLYEGEGVAPDKRLALLEEHQALINRDEIIAREINLEIFAGKYDTAIQLMKSRFFRAWEGGVRFSLGDAWVNAWLLRGHRHFSARQYKEALADYQSALELPSNLMDATGDITSRRGEVWYWAGKTYEALGSKEQARKSWRDAAQVTVSPEPSSRSGGESGGLKPVGGLGAGVHVPEAAMYYQALSLQALGESEPAKTILEKLSDAAKQRLTDAPAVGASTKSTTSTTERVRVADAHYVAGLVQLGLNNRKSATQEFALALQASPDHLAAETALSIADLR